MMVNLLNEPWDAMGKSDLPTRHVAIAKHDFHASGTAAGRKRWQRAGRGASPD
jgi:hypothetical protein